MKKLSIFMLVLAMAFPIGAYDRGDVNHDGSVSIADVTSLIDYLLSNEWPGSSVPAYEYVDLGLPSGTLWATCNVGANAPEEYGDYFAWGETVPNKENYSWTTTAWVYYEGSSLRFSKYNTSEQYGAIDNKTELDLEDDAAYVNWGPEWRTPSADQINELLTQCTWEWVEVNGVNCRKITGSNGKSIFLPAAGQRSGANTSSVGTNGNYWSRDLYATTTVNPMNAFKLYFSKTMKQRTSGSRNYGCSVRPVYASQDVPTDDYERGDVNQDGNVTIADVTTLIDYLLSNVWPDPVPVVYYVDLGLPSGTLWATRNVGAETPEDFGDYFAWGEIQPKDAYSWSNYLWADVVNGKVSLNKYNTKTDNGTVVDDKTELDLEDDAAYVNYPDGQMPSKEQLEELVANCTWEWTQSNGVNGQLVTGPNGNTMFLPASGYHLDGNLYKRGMEGHYWTRSMNSLSPTYFVPLNGTKLFFSETAYNVNSGSRNTGYTVRAVRAPQE